MCDHSANIINTCDHDKPESLEHHVCEHQMCQLCLKEYIQTGINHGDIVMACPIETQTGTSCPGLVSYYDIQRVDPSLATMYTDMIRNTVQYRTPECWDWDEKPIQCPNCKLLLYRNGGCEVIYCLCGFVFCSDCMMLYVGCRC